ncbi:peptidoglycan DD-metalloendopeptidase family protein [Leucobacter tenebrionis]|uniref:peptidoglycan DD-metalloendopeptidase family protein n=1 Tax=Leucobacter tenebrionis TaxID=2873270 RepID=UPI001CA6DBDB|nr:peptidoglycan DD-metalloendopeptidase family protein [Leucobacter tenebrionis]QZY52928.1 M23 family metallopeptidase [Leucobacter tenebrionis]
MSIQQLVRMIRDEVVATLQNSSIGSAGLRIYGGGWIRIENGGLSVTGTAVVSGSLQVTGTLLQVGPWTMEGPGTITGNVGMTGDLTGSGMLRWTGDWKLEGDGEISGDVKITGDTEILGKLDVTGDTRLRGKTTLENDLIVTEDGKIKVGDMTIDPSAGAGRVRFANGGQVWAEGGSVKLMLNRSQVSVTEDSILVSSGGNSVAVGALGIQVRDVPTTTNTDSLHWLGVNSAGYLRKVDPAVGGPLGGPFEWPFPLSSVTSEFGPRPEMGDYHTGMDFGQPSGTPIPAPAAGTVVASGWVDNFGGYHIKIDHGMRGGKKLETGYFHLVEAPALQPGAMVAKGTIVGHVGSTGASTGPHLHWETFIDGVQVNPRSFMDAYGKK